MTFVGGKFAKWSINPNCIVCCEMVLPLMNYLKQMNVRKLCVNSFMTIINTIISPIFFSSMSEIIYKTTYNPHPHKKKSNKILNERKIIKRQVIRDKRTLLLWEEKYSNN